MAALTALTMSGSRAGALAGGGDESGDGGEQQIVLTVSPGYLT